MELFSYLWRLKEKKLRNHHLKKRKTEKNQSEPDPLVPFDSVFSASHFPWMNGYFCSTHYYSRFDTSPFMKDAYPVTNALPVCLASSSDQFPPFAIQMFSVCVTRYPHSSKLSLFGSSASSLCDDLCVHSIKAHVLSLYVMCVYMCTLWDVDPGFLVDDLCVHSHSSCFLCSSVCYVCVHVYIVSGGSRISCWCFVCAHSIKVHILSMYVCMPLADPIGTLGVRVPLSVQFLSFSCSFRQRSCKVIAVKSWIRHCMCLWWNQYSSNWEEMGGWNLETEDNLWGFKGNEDLFYLFAFFWASSLANSFSWM